MCQVQMLRALVNQRLTAAVEEIFVVLERTIAEYEEELSRTKEENERQRQRFDAAFRKHRVVRHGADASEEHLWQRLHCKEEEEEHSISQVIGAPVKSEDDEDDGEGEEKREAEPPSSSSTQHITEADGDHCGGSPADKLLAPLSDSEHTTSHSPDTDDDDDEDSTADMTCHPDNTRFKCHQCDKSFHYRRSLKRHMRLHTGENPSACSVCKRRFSWGYLKIHMRRHTGEKPFTCSICHKSFCQRSTLIRHMRIHTGEKVLSCSVCAERFSYKYQLMNHKCAAENNSSK